MLFVLSFTVVVTNSLHLPADERVIYLAKTDKRGFHKGIIWRNYLYRITAKTETYLCAKTNTCCAVKIQNDPFIDFIVTKNG